MNDLAEFLLARLDEDEFVARKAPGPKWVKGIEREGSPGHWRGTKAQIVALPSDDPIGSLSMGDELLRSEAAGNSSRAFWTVDHVGRWDPARVLAEVEGKRQIVDLWRRETAGLNEDEIVFVMSMSEYPSDVLTMLSATLRRLILPYSDHPDFREEWRP